jgi:hypothetical protein
MADIRTLEHQEETAPGFTSLMAEGPRAPGRQAAPSAVVLRPATGLQMSGVMCRYRSQVQFCLDLGPGVGTIRSAAAGWACSPDESGTCRGRQRGNRIGRGTRARPCRPNDWVPRCWYKYRRLESPAASSGTRGSAELSQHGGVRISGGGGSGSHTLSVYDGRITTHFGRVVDLIALNNQPAIDRRQSYSREVKSGGQNLPSARARVRRLARKNVICAIVFRPFQGSQAHECAGPSAETMHPVHLKSPSATVYDSEREHRIPSSPCLE